MHCRICDQEHAHYDPFDNNWYCQDCQDAIDEVLSEYDEIEEITDDYEE